VNSFDACHACHPEPSRAAGVCAAFLPKRTSRGHGEEKEQDRKKAFGFSLGMRSAGYGEYLEAQLQRELQDSRGHNRRCNLPKRR
jgi:hypothetical protein